MTGLDFEELDKAVQEAMGQSSEKKDSGKPVKDAGSRNYPDGQAQLGGVFHDIKPHTLQRSDAGSSFANSTVVDEFDNASKEDRVLATRPTLGRYMDMKAHAIQPQVIRNVGATNRQGVDLEPIADSKSTSNYPTTNEMKDHITNEDKTSPETDRTDEYGTSNYSSLSIGDLENAAEPEKVEKGTDSAEAQSPFLTDAKVEKTPLGQTKPLSFINDKYEDIEKKEELEDASETENLDKIDNELKPEAPSIEEYSEDLLAIESDDIATETSPMEESKHKESDSSKTENIENNSGNHVDSHGSGSELIRALPPRTYAKKVVEDIPVDSEDSHSQIYDTAAYQHEHTETKRSGWGHVVGIIALIFVGVAASVVVFFVLSGSL